MENDNWPRLFLGPFAGGDSQLLIQCPRCRALMLEVDRQAHVEWHNEER